jgi:hypothetical protein
MRDTQIGMLKKWMVKAFYRLENLTTDVKFAQQLNPVPTFTQFAVFAEDNEKSRDAINKYLPHLYDYHRVLNFAELTRDELLNVYRDSTTTEIAPIITKVSYDSKYGRSINIG